MNTLRHTFLVTLFFCGSSLFTGLLYCQKVLELLPGSQKLGYNEETGAHRLIGSVNFTYQGNTMYCDSAHYFDKTEEVRAYGNVHITKGDINLFCDSLYYNGATKKAKLWGHVRVRDLEYKLTTDTLEYNAKLGEGIYRHGGKIESITSNEILTSKVGYFYPETNNCFFRGKVSYKNDDLSMTTDTLKYTYANQTTFFYGPTDIKKGKTFMHCEKGWYNVKNQEGSLMHKARIIEDNKQIDGDTLLYQPEKGRYIGRGHVAIVDTSGKMEFYGNYALNSIKDHYSFITGNVLAVKKYGEDTIYIHADTLFNQNDTLDNILYSKGYRNVKIFNTNVQAKCDSLIYTEETGQMELYTKPIVWAQNAELKGEKMDLFLLDSILDKIVVTEDATGIMELDSGMYYNQIEGKIITAYFTDNKLTKTDVNGNAKTLFYPEEEEKTDSVLLVKRLGMNRLYASELRIYLDSGEVTGITYFDKPEGVFYPMDRINKEEQFISNFAWNPMLRPRKVDDLRD